MTFGDWRLVIVAAAAQILFAGALRVASMSVVRRGAARCRPLARALAHGPDDRVVWATTAAGRRLGAASTCLTRALAASLLLEDADTITLTIGVKRTSDERVEAHAWLTRGGRVLIGLPFDEYALIAEWPGRSA